MPCREGVKEIEEQSHQAHEPGANIFVSPVDGRGGRSNPLVAFEYPMTGRFPELGQPGNVVPETNQFQILAIRSQARANSIDLRALSGSIDAGETYEDGPSFLFP
jgi:hypothetical protein